MPRLCLREAFCSACFSSRGLVVRRSIFAATKPRKLKYALLVRRALRAARITGHLFILEEFT